MRLEAVTPSQSMAGSQLETLSEELRQVSKLLTRSYAELQIKTKLYRQELEANKKAYDEAAKAYFERTLTITNPTMRQNAIALSNACRAEGLAILERVRPLDDFQRKVGSMMPLVEETSQFLDDFAMLRRLVHNGTAPNITQDFTKHLKQYARSFNEFQKYLESYLGQFRKKAISASLQYEARQAEGQEDDQKKTTESTPSILRADTIALASQRAPNPTIEVVGRYPIHSQRNENRYR
jgi:hypothetical protein